tara:strand:- start:4047 stop:4787 length:741 start_codon:yes stop_codon:yes gene_type:complete
MRKDKNEEFVCGVNLVEAILRLRPNNAKTLFILETKSNSRIEKISSLANKNKIEVLTKGKEFFHTYFEQENHQGLALLCWNRLEESEDLLDELLKKESLLILILDHLTDPHNVGACLRNAAAVNADAVIVPKNRSCHLTPTVRKVSSGGSELVPFIVVTNLVRTIKKLQMNDVNVIGSDKEGDINYQNIKADKKNALVIGSEDKGLKKLTAKNCDFLVKIEMPGTMESLNASVASGILLFEMIRKN